MGFYDDARILARINNEKQPKLTPRQRQAKSRRNAKQFLAVFVFVAIVFTVFIISISVPTKRDSFEATKNQNWQRQVAEYQK